MTPCETLHPDQFLSVLRQACQEHAPVTVSFLSEGKWHLMKLTLAQFSDEHIVLSDVKDNVSIYQPVGICILSGHYKYLFDSQVSEVKSGVNGSSICIDYPQTAERMPRRAFLRQSVPASMNVKVLFWHRGYMDGCEAKPDEQYWQGRLLNLSAGGAQFEIDNSQKRCFSSGQLLGVQFTPMSYQIPFLLESHVKYLRDNTENGHFKIGVEFLGLETPEGRDSLHRLLEVLKEYQQMNLPQNDTSAAS